MSKKAIGKISLILAAVLLIGLMAMGCSSPAKDESQNKAKDNAPAEQKKDNTAKKEEVSLWYLSGLV